MDWIVSGALTNHPAIRMVARRLPRWVKDGIAQYLAGADGRRQWLRQTMNANIGDTIAALPPDYCDALEVSGNLHELWHWQSYQQLWYPEFDLCCPQEPLPGPFDVVICEQVLEHVADPISAVTNLCRLIRPRGLLIVSTPFLVKLHDHPGDYWRFAPAGLALLLQYGGFENIRIHSWGNPRAILANLGPRWTPYRPWHSLRNNPITPAVVWAFANRAAN